MILNCKSKLENGQDIELFIDLKQIVAIYKCVHTENANDPLLFIVLPTRELPIFDYKTANEIILYFDTQEDIRIMLD